jgi:hypothetical protein
MWTEKQNDYPYSNNTQHAYNSIFITLYTCYLYISFTHSALHQWFYSPLLGPGLFLSFVIFFTLMVGFLWRVISPSQGRYLHIGQHKHRINTYTDIHVLSGIRIHDPRVWASEDSLCLRPRGHRDRHPYISDFKMWILTGFRTLPIVRNSRKQKTQRFGNGICFRPQVSGGKDTYFVGSLRKSTVLSSFWNTGRWTKSKNPVILSCKMYNKNK